MRIKYGKRELPFDPQWFDRRYKDKGGLDALVGMLNSRRTYQSIGEHFGVTRQRVHQMAVVLKANGIKIEPRPFRGAKSKQEKKVEPDLVQRIARKRANPTSSSAKSALGEYKVFSKLKNLGFQVQVLPRENDPVDFVVNGFAVVALVRNKPRKVTPSTRIRYFTFQISNRQLERADFVVCFVAPQDTFYVIPVDKLKSEHIYIPDVDDYSGVYSEFRDAWHSLLGKGRG